MQRRDLLKASLLFTGFVASASVSRALQAGVAAGSAPAKRVFTQTQRKVVSLLSEMIIPETDTPGAIEAGVPDFIETIVGEWYRPLESEIFFQGLKDLDAYCREHADSAFHEASADVRAAALQRSEKAAAAYTPAVPGGGSPLANFRKVDEETPFFTKLKELVVLGYYTSEVGAKQELAYNPVPGRFDGDYDFEKIGRQWIY